VYDSHQALLSSSCPQPSTPASALSGVHASHQWVALGAGKGWFYLNEKDRETYEFSKLRKFLTTVRFTMEDTLRFLVQDNLARFEAFITSCCTARVTVTATNSVSVEGAGKKLPLLLLELTVTKENTIAYATPVPSVVAKVVRAMDNGIAKTQVRRRGHCTRRPAARLGGDLGSTERGCRLHLHASCLLIGL
jgi:hypothetical protein